MNHCHDDINYVYAQLILCLGEFDNTLGTQSLKCNLIIGYFVSFLPNSKVSEVSIN